MSRPIHFEICIHMYIRTYTHPSIHIHTYITKMTQQSVTKMTQQSVTYPVSVTYPKCIH